MITSQNDWFLIVISLSSSHCNAISVLLMLTEICLPKD